MITPADLRNPKRLSGYNFVSRSDIVYGKPNPLPFQAQHRWHGKAFPADRWRGPQRATALDAAQDYCDHVNGLGVQPTVSLKSAGHSHRRAKTDNPEIAAALGLLKDARAQRRGVQGWVYLIYEILPGGGLRYGKIGYSTNPRARVAELQTGNPRPLMLGGVKKGTEADEKALHAKYHSANVLQEWFVVSKELALEFNPPKLEVDLP